MKNKSMNHWILPSRELEMLVNFPGFITLGQRRKALRRLFGKRLGWAMHDKALSASEADLDPDAWLERAIGETVVRAYALGMLHSRHGAKAEVSSPYFVNTPNENDTIIHCLDWEGKPGDRRPCDAGIESLHQVLRDCLPGWSEEASPLAAIRSRIAQLTEARSWLAGARPFVPPSPA